MNRRILSSFAAGLLLSAAPALPGAKAFVAAQGRGVNLGNMLEAPSEGAWSVVLKKQDPALIASKGLANVRIPVRWDGKGVGTDASFDRVARTAPYTVDPRFFARVDSAIRWARENRLMVVLNDHHHDSLFQNLSHERPRFIALWKQIAERYASLPTDSVAFEILNEPNTQVTPEEWNSLLDTVLKVVRVSNPNRPVVIGTANWGGLSGLSGLVLPPDDTNLILTIHYYEPFAFTHQGADWVSPIPPVGTKWNGTYYEKLAVRQAMDAIADFAKAHDVPVFIGEFGAYSTADMASRARWAAYCARLFESYGFSWAWWEFKAGFGIYDEGSTSWRTDLVQALTSNDASILDPGTPPTGGVDLVTNGGFSSKTRWSFYANSGTASFAIVDTAARIRVDEAAAKSWDMQLSQQPLVVKAGVTYVLQFDAWASSPKTISGEIGMSADPWTVYSSASAGLATTRRTFFTSFTATKTDSSARVCFNLGTDTGTIRIDDVKLLAWDPNGTAVPRRTSLPPPSVRWRAGTLQARHSSRPSWSRVVSPDGRYAAPLSWQETADGWISPAPNLGPGVWILAGSDGNCPIFVAR